MIDFQTQRSNLYKGDRFRNSAFEEKKSISRFGVRETENHALKISLGKIASVSRFVNQNPNLKGGGRFGWSVDVEVQASKM